MEESSLPPNFLNMSLPYGPPQKVSPLIRGARWGLLIAGIFYGVSKQRIYSKKEAKWREEEAKRKVVRDAQLAIEKQKSLEEEKTWFQSPPKGGAGEACPPVNCADPPQPKAKKC